MGSGVGCWEAGGRRQSRRTGNWASTCFILLDWASSCFILLDWASSCFALAGSVFFILGDSAAGDGDAIAVYGTINWGCVSCCAKVVNF